MERRRFLRGTAITGSVGIAGCLERLGFEEESAWSNPPLVENRPDAVYLPAGTEEMGRYGRASDGDYAVELSYTFPHRFWIVAGETERVDVDVDDSMHLMVTVWDAETHTVLPVNVGLELRRDGDSVGGQLSPWPMLSQRMGFHYGDNISLPEEGQYTARIDVGPVEPERTGAFEDRLDGRTTLEIDFEFDRSDIHDLDLELIDEERRGDRDALELMEHDERSHDDSGGEHHHDDSGPRPTSVAPPIDDLPGERLGTERSADAKISLLEADADRMSDGPVYLAICPRTPYHDISLPFASFSLTVDRAGSPVVENEPLVETLDHEFGHHYGTGLADLERGDEITVSVDAPPQVARHDGYETAFFEFQDVSFSK